MKKPMESDRKSRELSEDAVDIWRIDFSLPQNALATLEKHLGQQERDRSRQFRFEQDRRRYVISHGVLREILARYLSVHPARLAFEYGATGKPSLAFAAGHTAIGFNLSHCNDLAVIAVAMRRSVGIDVEKVREIPELQDILRRYFTEEDRLFVCAVEGQDRVRNFLTVWTRREAVAKALGLDLAAALGPLPVPLYPQGQQIKLDGLDGIGALSSPIWSLNDLPFDPLHVGALCIEGAPCTLIFHEYDAL